MIWFFWAEKMEKLRQSVPQMRIDPVTGAAFEAFPQDHRVPEIAQFMANPSSHAQALMGEAASALPVLVRYRPGLSATFRWTTSKGAVHFVKIARKADVGGQAAVISALARQLQGKAARVSEVAGFASQIGAIAYRAAAGQPFDAVLPALTGAALARSTQLMLGGLAALWECDLPGQDRMDRADYLRRAERSARIIATADQDAGQRALAILQQAAAASPALRHRPIHGDMKLDHAFLDKEAVTLIDTESVISWAIRTMTLPCWRRGWPCTRCRVV